MKGLAGSGLEERKKQQPQRGGERQSEEGWVEGVQEN